MSYQIRVRGQLGRTMRAAFPALHAAVPRYAVSATYGLIVWSFLVELDRMPGPAAGRNASW